MKRWLFLALVSAFTLCAACGRAEPMPSTLVTTTGTSAVVSTTTPTTTAQTIAVTYPIRTEATRPAVLQVAENARGFNSDGHAGVADMLMWEGTLYHAVDVCTVLSPGEPVGHITASVARDVRPTADGQCNYAPLVGRAVYAAGDCLYTVEEWTADADSPHSGPVYRQWQKGVATNPGSVADGYNALRFEGALYRRIRWFNIKEDGVLEGDFLTADSLPADKGFVWAGEILAEGAAAPKVEYGSDIGGLGRELYASTAYASFLYVGDEESGYWVLVNTEAPLTCGSIRQEAGGTVLDLSTATEEDIAYLASLMSANTTVLPVGSSLELFGITEVKWPTGGEWWADAFYLGEV